MKSTKAKVAREIICVHAGAIDMDIALEAVVL
jgi:hypothetical protein